MNPFSSARSWRGRALCAALACTALVAWPRVAAAAQLDNFDPGFGSGGTAMSDAVGGASGMALQPDGKIVVAGSLFASSGEQEVGVARFNADGSPDSSFGSGGRVALQLGAGSTPSSGATSVAVQADGRIVVAGSASGAGGSPELLVARLNADGSPDSTFDGDGKLVNQPSGAASSQLGAVAIQPDGKIVVGGSASNSNGDTRVLVARISATTGGFDSTFGSGGKVLRQLGPPAGTAEQVNALALQVDGKIVLGGSAADSAHRVAYMVARLRGTDGGLDSGFGSGGTVLRQLGAGDTPLSTVLSLAIQPDGKILAGGDASPGGSGNPGFLVTRLGPSGAPDASFGANGSFLTQLGTGFNAFSSATSLALQPDGKIVAAGVTTDSNSDNAVLLARLTDVGVLDPGFGSNGVLAAQLGGGEIPFSQASSVALLPDGRIQLAGVANTSAGGTDVLLARVFHDAAPSPAFAVVTNPAVAGAPVTFDAGASSDPDGSVAGYSWDFGDGGRASGARVTHTFSASGDYAVRLTVTDDRGLSASVTRAVSVAPPNQLNPAFLATMSALGISPAAFRAAAAGPTVSARTGAIVSYRDSRAATTTFQVWRAMRGTFSMGHCVKPSRSAHGRRCARFVKIGQFTRADHVGLNRFHFSGRLRGHKLRPGRYHLRGVPTFGGRTGIAARTDFRILR